MNANGKINITVDEMTKKMAKTVKNQGFDAPIHS